MKKLAVVFGLCVFTNVFCVKHSLKRLSMNQGKIMRKKFFDTIAKENQTGDFTEVLNRGRQSLTLSALAKGIDKIEATKKAKEERVKKAMNIRNILN